MNAITTKGYLIVRANGDLRITKKRNPLRIDEVAFPLTVTIPATWGRVQSTSIDVALPEPPEAIVTVADPELDTGVAVPGAEEDQ